MNRRVVLNEEIAGADVLIEEPRWFTWAANGADVAGQAARWLLIRVVPALLLLAGAVWLALQVLWAVVLGVTVFALIPAAVFGFRAFRITWDEIGGL